MADVSTVVAVASQLKAAFDIGKAVLDAKGSMDTAELKLKLAEMMSSLADAKIALVDLQDEIHERDRHIASLNESLKNRDTVVKHYDAYYTKNAAGQATGAPYCMSCWERFHSLYHLATHRGSGNACPACKNTYDPSRTRDIVEEVVR